MTVTQINRIVAVVGKRARVRPPNPLSKTGNINPHLFRNTYARSARTPALTIEEVQGLMRHASFKTTCDLYGTLKFEEIQKRYEEKLLPRL